MSDFGISITVADRPYRLKIEPDKEELYRKAATLVESRMKAYSTNYAYKDKQDLLAMVALDSAFNFLLQERNHQDKNLDCDKKLSTIDAILTEALTEQSA